MAGAEVPRRELRKVKWFKVTTLAENFAYGRALGQWGLSFLVEYRDSMGTLHKFISDTGSDKRSLLYNIKQLKADLKGMEAIFLSHGHADHTASTVELLRLAQRDVKVVIHPYLFNKRYYMDKNGKKHSVRALKGEQPNDITAAGGQLVQSKESIEFLPGVATTGQVERMTDFEVIREPRQGPKFKLVVDGSPLDDTIPDDQSIFMNVEGVGPLVITGCAHSGLINTLQKVSRLGGFQTIYGVIGGTHLVGRKSEYIDRTIAEAKKYGLKLMSPCHCTGFNAASRIAQAFPEAFVFNYSGRIIESGKEASPRIV